MPNKLRAREAGDSTSGSSFFERAFARFQAQTSCSTILGLTPQALRQRPLRGLKADI